MIGIIGFALAMALIIGVTIPIANKGRDTGANAYQNGKEAWIKIDSILR